MSVIGLPCVVCGTFAAVMNADAYERATLAELVCVCAACEAQIEADGDPEVLLADEMAIRAAVAVEQKRLDGAAYRDAWSVEAAIKGS